jgi:phosphonopyruvate decarboxylase
MRIPWEPFPTEPEALDAALGRVVEHMASTGLSYGLVLQKGSIEASATGRHRTPEKAPPGTAVGALGSPLDPDEALRAVGAGLDERDVVLATTGFTGRALYAVGDRPSQLYMVGSMGCASSMGLGLALARPERRIVVLDGDGAMLMHLGAAAIVGHEGPENLLHVLLDNGVHDSTGAQATVSPAVDLATVATACGYAGARRVASAGELTAAVAAGDPGPRLVHVRTAPRANRKLPRPTQTPPEVARRLQEWLERNP